jgi:hypothetical protein
MRIHALLWAALFLSTSRGLAFDPKDYKLPPGFQISVYKDGLTNARSLTRSQADGKAEIVYVSTMSANKVGAT